MVSAKELYAYLDSIAPFDTALGFDNAGLLIGSGETVSETVYTALDATKDVLLETAAAGAKILITHHPIIFDALKSVPSDSVVYLAVQLGVTVLSAHTNLDIAEGGVNDTLAEALGVQIEQRFPFDCAVFGSLNVPMNCTGLAQHIKNKVPLKGLRYTDSGKTIQKVMIAGGAGGSDVFLAKDCGADAIITGEIKHHQILFSNDSGTAVFDLGHFGSEDLVITKLTARLQKAFPQAVFRQASADTDGVQYLT